MTVNGLYFAKRSARGQSFPQCGADYLLLARTPTQDDESKQTDARQRNG